MTAAWEEVRAELFVAALENKETAHTLACQRIAALEAALLRSLPRVNEARREGARLMLDAVDQVVAEHGLVTPLDDETKQEMISAALGEEVDRG